MKGSRGLRGRREATRVRRRSRAGSWDKGLSESGDAPRKACGRPRQGKSLPHHRDKRVEGGPRPLLPNLRALTPPFLFLSPSCPAVQRHHSIRPLHLAPQVPSRPYLWCRGGPPLASSLYTASRSSPGPALRGAGAVEAFWLRLVDGHVPGTGTTSPTEVPASLSFFLLQPPISPRTSLPHPLPVLPPSTPLPPSSLAPGRPLAHRRPPASALSSSFGGGTRSDLLVLGREGGWGGNRPVSGLAQMGGEAPEGGGPCRDGRRRAD